MRKIYRVNDDLYYIPSQGLLIRPTAVGKRDLSEGAQSSAVWWIDELIGPATQPDVPACSSTIDAAKALPVTVGVFLTNACSLRCTYCYSDGGRNPRVDLDTSKIDRLIKYIGRNVVIRKRLGIPATPAISLSGGGEPTVAWDRLQYLVHRFREMCHQQGVDGQMAVSTNGFLSEDKVYYLAEHFDQVNLSYDGTPEAHDRCRPTAAGEPSSHVVERTLAILNDSEVRFGIRCTITKHNVTHLSEIASRLFTKYPRCLVIQVEPMFRSGRGLLCKDGVDDPHELATEVIKAMMTSARYGRWLLSTLFNPRRIGPFVCAAAASLTFWVTPEGFLSACTEISAGDHGYEQYIRGFLSDSGVSYVSGDTCSKLHRRLDGGPCSTCFAWEHCRGYCPNHAPTDEYGNFTTAYGRFICAATRAVWYRALTELAKSNGRFVYLNSSECDVADSIGQYVQAVYKIYGTSQKLGGT